MKRALSVVVVALAVLCAAGPARAQAGQLKLPAYKKVRLKNGMTLLLMEHHEVPMVSVQFILKAGGTADPAGKEGLASITAALLRKGTRTRTADQFSAEMDFIGGTFGAGASADSTGGSAEFLKKDLDKGLDLLADVLLNPTFPQDEVTKLLKQRIDGIKSAKDAVQAVIGNYFNGYLYGKHPYARPTGGDEKTLAAITRDDVAKFYETNYAPGNTILAVAGDFDAAAMEKTLAAKFAAWPAPMASGPARQAPAGAVPEPAPATGKKLLLVDKPDSTQTYYWIGHLGIARSNPDRVAIDVVNTLFGGRFTSMLNSELRVNSGLTYGAFSFFDERRTRGPFVISSYTQNATTEKALDMTLDILKRLHEKGISEEELQSAKAYVKGQYPPNLETTDQLAGLLADLEFHGLDEREVNDYYARVDALTVAEARRIIRQYFPLDNLVFVLVGKASEIEPLAKKYAAVLDRKSISDPGF